MSAGLAVEVAGDLFPDYIFEPVEAPRFGGADRRPWIAYARLSRKDPREGFGQHVKMDDQADQISAYIERLDPGAEVIHLRDNKSAFLPDVHREGYERAVAMVARGEVKGLVSIHSDRVTRQVGQASTLWASLERSGAQLHTTHTGWIQDPTMMQMEAVIAERESRIKRERNKNHHRRLAEAGKNPGGHRRFGYEPGMGQLREAEAGALREVAARVLAGETLASCVRWLEGADLPEEERPRFHTPRGGKWTTGNLSEMLRRPMLAGVRTYGGRIVARAEWPAVFDWEQHEALVRLLGDPARRTAASTKSKYLLAGLGTCAECGALLRGRPARPARPGTGGRNRSGGGGGSRFPVYTCDTGRHVHRRTDVVDDALVRLVVARLSAADAAGVFVEEGAELREATLTEKRDGLLARRKEYAAKAARGKIGVDMAAEVDSTIAADLALVQQELDAVRDARSAPLAALDGMTGPRAREAWDALTEAGAVGRQRAILRLLCSSITLAGGERAWEPERLLRVEFHTRPGAD